MNGHRQSLSVVKISEILMDGKSIGSVKTKKPSTPKSIKKKEVVKKKAKPNKE